MTAQRLVDQGKSNLAPGLTGYHEGIHFEDLCFQCQQAVEKP